MTVESFAPPQNPVELAHLRAQQTTAITDGFEITPEEEQVLAELDYAADQCGFIGQQYYMSATRGFIIPKEFDATEITEYDSVSDLMAEGPFATYAKVRIGKLIGHGTVRAVCLSFDQALILPYFAELDEDKMLFIPVLAVESIITSS